jgi:hypothetical protein
LSQISNNDFENKKRKYQENENDLTGDQFNWISDQEKGKRIKMNKETIVQKRLEYFSVFSN